MKTSESVLRNYLIPEENIKDINKNYEWLRQSVNNLKEEAKKLRKDRAPDSSLLNKLDIPMLKDRGPSQRKDFFKKIGKITKEIEQKAETKSIGELLADIILPPKK